MKPLIFALMIIAVVSLAIFASTDVVTLLAGTHTWTEISSDGNTIICTDCHSTIQNELDNSSIHSGLTCEDCHRFTDTGITFASGDGTGSTPGKEAHAAYTPRCLDCHNRTSITLANGTAVTIEKADAFGDANYGTDFSAHKKFVEDSLNYNLSVGENEACIMCHTNYSAEIDYSYFWNIEYELDNWNVPFTSFSYNGTRNYDISFSKSGAKHEFVSTSDINCISCHKNIYDALVNGTPKSNEDYLSHSPIEIYTSGMMGKDWDEDNPWGHYRFHYIPEANRATGVNSSYCYKCHTVKKYADNNPSDNTTYSLGDVTSDTNSTQVHAAEALWCQTCHGSGKTKVVIDNQDYSMMAGNDGHTGETLVDDIKNNYARTFHGDICMGCHEAAVHPNDHCSSCHKNSNGNADVYIESEPSGYATVAVSGGM